MQENNVTRLLEAVNAGQSDAYWQLLCLVNNELKRMAASRLRGERAGHTLQPTALVNEAYLRLAQASHWDNRAHFFGAAAEAMRRILVDHARKRASHKRGADAEEPDVDLLALHKALSRLKHSPLAPHHIRP